ncbi:MAG: hypothetical protein ACYC27_09175 [Armatimonadota bacterium]
MKKFGKVLDILLVVTFHVVALILFYVIVIKHKAHTWLDYLFFISVLAFLVIYWTKEIQRRRKG